MPYGFNADKTKANLNDTYYTETEVDNKLNEKQKAITISDNAPSSSDGSNGDIWIEY